VSSGSHGDVLLLLLVSGIGVGLLVAALASQPALTPLYERRETLMSVGLVTAASGLGVAIVLLSS
jgi:membrane associated rhomboid family serine protease